MSEEVQKPEEVQKLPEITPQEWLDLSNALEQHHALFYQCWQMGRPFLTEEVPTAAVRFNRRGEYIEFLFNPHFWESLNVYERIFVISHECLHVILNHGLRTVSTDDKERANKSLDIVVNETLAHSFGFDRSLIRMEKELCWADTVFPKQIIPTDESFEYYYLRTPESLTMKLLKLLDDHSGLAGDLDGDKDGTGAEAWKKIIDKLNEKLTDEEKAGIKRVIQRHYCGDGGKQAGVGTGSWTFVNVGKVGRKRKWETVIQKWSMKYLRQDYEDKEQWARLHRRFSLLPSDLFLPSEMEEDELEKDRLPVYLFLDTSGSCWGYKERFFKAGASLPKDRFDVRLFCFDTAVKETTIESGQIYGGGGTAFDIIENHIQHVMKDEGKAYAEGVFVITDGYGGSVKPQHPGRWHWFLTPYSSKDYIPKESQVHELKDYE